MTIRNIVLVHGNFVDGSGWQGVYDHLTADGYRVAVVQNPTLSLGGDVAATRQVLDSLDGPAVLVGHSYGGVVGGFNRSSQHLDLEVCGWDGREGGRRLRRAGRRCGRRGARRWPGGSIGSGSGRRSGAGCRVRTRQWRLACRSRSGPGGSVRLAGWPRSPRPRCPGRFLSFTEREEIAILHARGCGVCEIARRTARSPSTISRELRRNAATRGGTLEYRATTA